jgi:hypothetical protein
MSVLTTNEFLNTRKKLNPSHGHQNYYQKHLLIT